MPRLFVGRVAVFFLGKVGPCASWLMFFDQSVTRGLRGEEQEAREPVEQEKES